MLINNMFTGSLEPSATVAGCVEIFENAWPDPEIAVTRLEMECGNTDSGMGWNRAHTVGQGVRQQARTNLSLNITQAGEGSNNQVAKDIHNQFFYLLLATTVGYADRMHIDENLYHEPYQALKYRAGEGYNTHYDGGTELGRAVSAICYLNDDYEGGDFIADGNTIPQEVGTAIELHCDPFSPETSPVHGVTKITKGTRYSLVSWSFS